MKKIKCLVIFCLVSTSSLKAVTPSERYWEKKAFSNIPKGFGLHTDLAYSSYLIELHSSEMDSAIDYDILEATVGLSYVNDRWLVGTYGKFIINELQSNMYVVTTQAPLNDEANIDKSEFGIYVNYTLFETQKERWGFNTIYRYAKLNASDSYVSFLNYASYFKYETEGLALSLAYQREVLNKGFLLGSIGVLYSKAKVEISESVNGQFQDSYIDDSVNALGTKVSLGYNYAYSKDLSIHLRTDIWKQNFDSLEVTSRVGDTLPSAALKEISYSSYLGMAWRF